jgi:chemotaxis protein CheX
MDVNYINPFITSSRKVFELMIKLPLTIGRPHLRGAEDGNYAVSAVIGLGGAVTGCVILGFSQRVALALAGGLAGSTFSAVDSDCVDALGEIVNMIAGHAKTELPGGLSTLSVPNVITGEHRVQYPTGIPPIVIPCNTQAGPFFIEIAIRKTAAPAAATPTTPAAKVATA